MPAPRIIQKHSDSPMELLEIPGTAFFWLWHNMISILPINYPVTWERSWPLNAVRIHSAPVKPKFSVLFAVYWVAQSAGTNPPEVGEGRLCCWCNRGTKTVSRNFDVLTYQTIVAGLAGESPSSMECRCRSRYNCSAAFFDSTSESAWKSVIAIITDLTRTAPSHATCILTEGPASAAPAVETFPVLPPPITIRLDIALRYTAQHQSTPALKFEGNAIHACERALDAERAAQRHLTCPAHALLGPICAASVVESQMFAITNVINRSLHQPVSFVDAHVKPAPGPVLLLVHVHADGNRPGLVRPSCGNGLAVYIVYTAEAREQFLLVYIVIAVAVVLLLFLFLLFLFLLFLYLLVLLHVHHVLIHLIYTAINSKK